MKKNIVFIFLLFSIFTKGSVAFANDGSLQIDTSLDKNTKKTEIQYFEQESNLTKLFHPETYKLIDTTKKLDKEKYQLVKKTYLALKWNRRISLMSISLLYLPIRFKSTTVIKRLFHLKT